MANVGPNVWYVRDNAPTSTIGWSAITAWHTGTVIAAGLIRRQLATPTVGSERAFVCIIAGTTHATTEPTWVVTKGAKTTDNTITWMECTGQPGVNGDHGAALATTTNAITAAGSSVLSFASVPAGVSVGQLVIDKTTITGVIPAGAKVASFTSTTVTLTAAVAGAGVGSGDAIAFTNCPTWLMNKNTAVTIGMVIQNGAGTVLLICTTAGTTSNSTEPTWSTTPGTINSDGATVKWTTLGLVGSFGAYAAPHARVANAITATWAASGDAVFVGNDHTETQSTAIVITGGSPTAPLSIICMDHTVVPPGTANITTGATVTTTGTSNLSWGNGTTTGIYVNGLTANGGTGGGAVTMGWGVASNSPNLNVFENCSFSLPATGASFYSWGTNSRCAKLRFTNCTFNFSAIGQIIQITSGDVVWKNTANAISGTMPTNLFTGGGSQPGCLICDGVDLSATTNVILMQSAGGGGKFLFMDCKLNSSATPGSIAQPGCWADFIRCSSAATDYDIKSYRYEGTLLSNTVVVRTGGASDGTTAVSYAITTTANCIWISPFEALPITIWNPTTAANVTVTLYGIANAASLPINDQVWFDVEYLGSATSPAASFATGSKANNLASGAALTADTSAWDSGVTVRSDSETVAVGTIRKTTDSPGLVWFCIAITTGVLAGSEPAGMGSASDGAVVIDGGATWRAGYRFRQAIVLSAPQPQIVGYLRCIPKAAITATTLYVDPQPVLS